MYIVTPQKKINLKANGVERILQNVSNLLSTIKGEIPLGRDIGLSSELIDMKINELAPVYTKEIIKLIHSKEPRAKVKSVKFETNGKGRVYPTVEVSIVE